MKSFTVGLVIEDKHVVQFLVNCISVDLLALRHCCPIRIAGILIPQSLMEIVISHQVV